MAAVTASLCFTSLFVGVFVLVSAEQKIITAEPGHNVTLPCQAPNNNNKIIVVEWSKADLKTKHVLLYRYELFAPALQDQYFKTRVELQDKQKKDGDVSLVLEDVNTDDTGTYECRIFMEGARTWNRTIIYLRVDPPDQKIITADPGQNVTLTCRGPNKIRGVEWRRADLEKGYVLSYRDGNFAPAIQLPSFKNRVDLQDRQMKDGDVSLILKDVTTADDGTYRCAVHDRTKRRKRAADTINIIYLSVPPEHKNITAEPGQDVTLPCRGPNNIKIIKSVEWRRAHLEDTYVLLYQDGQFDPDNQHPSFKNRVDLHMKDGDASLILKDVRIDDDGTYKCHVFMEGPQSWKPSSIINLSVAPPPGQP